MDISVLSLVKPGDTIEIHYINMKNEDVFLETLVYDVLSDKEILIHNPLKEGRLFMVPMDLRVTMFVKRADFGIVAFQTTLSKRKKIGTVYTISCIDFDGFEKQQRRNFFRVNMYKDIQVYFMRDAYMEPVKHYIFDPDAVDEEPVKMKVTLLDVSGGGIGVKSPVPLPEGTYVYGTLDFMEKPVEIYGVVVRSVTSEKYIDAYELGIAFEALPREVTRMITSFVFSRQQEARRKERT